MGVYISEAYTGQISGKRQFAISVRRSLPTGEFAGTIFTAVSVDHFTDFWRDYAPSTGYLVPMVRPDGAVIVRYPFTDGPDHLDPSGPFVSHLSRSRTGLYTAVSQVDGIKRINAYRQVRNYPLYVSFSAETSTVLQAWRRQATALVLLAILTSLLLTALWFAAVRRSHVQRLSAVEWETAARALQAQIVRREAAEESSRVDAEQVSFGNQLIGIVSHDLRNPLNTIMLTATVLARRETLAPADAQLLQRIQNAGERATRLVRDLLDFTQAKLGGRIPIHPRLTNFHELLKAVVEELDATYPDRITCKLHAQMTSGYWDPDRLSQVIENLVLNALKYGSEDGIVWINTTSTPDALRLEVQNDGKPIPAERITEIFAPLHRSEAAGLPNTDRSIGMGLFIVEHIVQAHGGTVSVESSYEHGTTFAVELPFVARDQKNRSREE